MKKTITILLLLITTLSFSQTTIKKSSIDSGGATVTNGTLSMVYSFGEVVVQEQVNGTISISEGFIEGDLTGVALGLEDYTQLRGLNLYPNPAIDIVNLSFPSAANYNVEIYNLLGEKIIAYQLKNKDIHQLNLGHLPNAVYLLLITNKEAMQFTSLKLIKN